MKFPWRGEMVAAADAVPLQAAELDHPSCPELVVRILEHASERALVGRLRVLSPGLHGGDRLLDLGAGAGDELELDPGHHLPWDEGGVAVRELELLVGAPASAGRVDDERPHENRLPVAAVGARVHAHAAARGAGDRAGELEAPEAGGAGAMEAHGIRRAAAGDEHRPAHLDRRQLVLEPDDERVHPGVGREQVGAEPDRPHVQPPLGRPRQRLFELGSACGAGRAPGRARRSRPSSSARAGCPPRSSRAPLRTGPVRDACGSAPPPRPMARA